MVRLEEKIKQLCRVNNVTQKQLYSAIGVTDAGMRKMYARNSCDASLLEKIADYFNIGISVFFDSDNDSVSAVNNSLAIHGNGNSANNDTSAFLMLLSKKDEQIDRLLGIIEKMNNAQTADA